MNTFEFIEGMEVDPKFDLKIFFLKKYLTNFIMGTQQCS